MNQNFDGATPVNGANRLLAGRYLLMDKVGEGGAAVVYRARDQRLDRIVAIKLLRPQFTTDDASRKRFLNEARTAAGLNHPNVVDIYDFGENPDGSMFIAMQYVEGQNLKDLLHRRGRLSVADLVTIIPQVCQALSVAHSRGLIHRDVKPQNIMIDSHGNVRLTDFGIVKALSGPELTQTGMTFGTAAYLSPEQATGDPVGPASDIYALGCVMYEMLSGSPPFTGDNPAVVAYKQVWEQPRPLHEWAPEVQPALESIIMRCLNKDPARRYATAAALATDLMNFGVAASQPTQAVALGAISSAQASLPKPYMGPQPSAEMSRPIPMPATAVAVPPVKVQTTGVAGQVTHRVEPAAQAPPSTARASRVQVVNPASRPSVAWVPVALIVIVLGLSVCALAATQGNIFGIFHGNATPTVPAVVATATQALPTPTLGSIVVITGTATLVPVDTSTATPVPPTDTPTVEVIPTDTPVPTVPAPPTVTPVPAPTETAQPIEPTATTEVQPPDTPTAEPVPLPSGTNSITIDAIQFHGGFTNPGLLYHGRTAEWVYGQGTPYHTMSVSFTINDQPAGQGVLSVTGTDSEDPAKTPVRFLVNDQVVYEGADPLPNDNRDGPKGPGNWGQVDLQIPAGVLRQGPNTITVINLDPSNKINYPIFVMLDEVTVSW